MENKDRGAAFSFFGFGLILIAPFLLWNPDFTLLDLLPDCVGYFLIYLSLRKMRDLNSYFEGAASAFFKVSIVSLLKMLFFFGINAISDASNGATWNLLLLMGFGIGEVLLLVPAWKAFFDGLSYSGLAYPVKKEKSQADRMYRATLRFLFAKQIITILPELSVLSAHDYVDYGHMHWDEYTSLFRVFAIFIILILGIVWLVRMMKFLKCTLSQRDAFAAMEADYRSRVVKRTGIFEMRRISLSLLLSAAAVFAACDVVFDNVNLTPDILAAVLLLLFFLFSPFVGKKRWPGAVLSVLYGGLSLTGDILAAAFRAGGSSLVMVQNEPKAWRSFWQYYPFRVADTAVFCVLTVLVYLVLIQVSKDHCGYVGDDVTEHYRQTKLAEIRRELRLKCVVSIVFAVLARGADAVCDYVSTLSGILGDTMGLITLALSVLAAVAFLRYAFAIYDHAKLKYMLL